MPDITFTKRDTGEGKGRSDDGSLVPLDATGADEDQLHVYDEMTRVNTQILDGGTWNP